MPTDSNGYLPDPMSKLPLSREQINEWRLLPGRVDNAFTPKGERVLYQLCDQALAAIEFERDALRLRQVNAELLAALKRAIPEIAVVGIPDLLEQCRDAIDEAMK